MASRVLVTGGAGFIGSHLVDFLTDQGRDVVVLDDFSTGSKINLNQTSGNGAVRIVEGTVVSAGDVAKAIDDCDTVFHLAVRNVRHSLGNPVENHNVNATGTLTVLEAARKAEVKRFVYCSSSEVYGNASSGILDETSTICAPVTVYGAAKFVGEHYTLAYLQTYGLPTTVIRPFNAYGPRSHGQGDSGEVIPRFVGRILNGEKPVVFGDGNQSRDFTYVAEIARGIALAASSREAVGRTINVAYGLPVTILDIAEMVAEVCERPDLKPIFSAARPGDVITLHANVELSRQLLSFKSEIDLRAGLRLYLDWIRQTTNDFSTLLDKSIENWSLPK